MRRRHERRERSEREVMAERGGFGGRSAPDGMSTVEGVQTRVAARRARFRDAVARLSERARSTELLRMLLLPGALAIVLGFVFMFFGWYGAARTAREIEQVPYLISGGFIGLAMVFVGGLMLACAFWMSMLQQFSQASDERAEKRIAELGERLAAAEEKPAPTRTRRR